MLGNSHLFGLCLSVLFLVNFVTTAVLRSNHLFNLDIIHYNDFHDRFEETSLLYPICTSNDISCLGGFSRLYYEINALLKEKPDALVLNAGDTFQGTYWYSLLKWNVTQHFINMLPNDAHAIGNHEFDGGIDDLALYLTALRAPMLAANLDVSAEPSLKGLMKPHIVIEKKGKKIGIIGLSTQATKVSSKPGKVEFLDPIKVAMQEVQNLTNQGIDIIVVLSHCGLDVDIEMAKVAGEHIDVIVGGHTHSLLWNGESPTKERVDGPYPVIVENDSTGHKVLIVTAAAYTKYLGNLTVYFDDKGEIVSHDGDAIFLNRSIPEDPEINKLLQPYADKLHKLTNEVVAHANESLIMNSCNYGECAIGNLFADAFLNATKKAKPSDLPVIAFLIRNMIKGSLPQGDITRGDLINTLFSNKMMTFILKGKHIVEAMEQCLMKTWSEKPFSGPWLPQVAGMRVTLNVTSKKVESLDVKVGDEFQPIQIEADYQVTAPDFIAYGGNGFKMLIEGQNMTMLASSDSQLVEEYLSQFSTLAPTLDQRLTLVT